MTLNQGNIKQLFTEVNQEYYSSFTIQLMDKKPEALAFMLRRDRDSYLKFSDRHRQDPEVAYQWLIEKHKKTGAIPSKIFRGMARCLASLSCVEFHQVKEIYEQKYSMGRVPVTWERIPQEVRQHTGKMLFLLYKETGLYHTLPKKLRLKDEYIFMALQSSWKMFFNLPDKVRMYSPSIILYAYDHASLASRTAIGNILAKDDAVITSIAIQRPEVIRFASKESVLNNPEIMVDLIQQNPEIAWGCPAKFRCTVEMATKIINRNPALIEIYERDIEFMAANPQLIVLSLILNSSMKHRPYCRLATIMYDAPDTCWRKEQCTEEMVIATIMSYQTRDEFSYTGSQKRTRRRPNIRITPLDGMPKCYRDCDVALWIPERFYGSEHIMEAIEISNNPELRPQILAIQRRMVKMGMSITHKYMEIINTPIVITDLSGDNYVVNNWFGRNLIDATLEQHPQLPTGFDISINSNDDEYILASQDNEGVMCYIFHNCEESLMLIYPGME